MELHSEKSIVHDLTKEISTLRAENADLKLQLYLHLPHLVLKPGVIPPQAAPPITTSDASTSTDGSKNEELVGACNLIRILEALNLKQHQKIISQDVKLQQFQKEMEQLKSTELEIFQFRIPSVRATTPCLAGTSREGKRGLRMESLLPSDYKASVATLPPISIRLHRKMTSPNKAFHSQPLRPVHPIKTMCGE